MTARERVAEFIRQWGMVKDRPDLVYGVHFDPKTDDGAELLASDLSELLSEPSAPARAVGSPSVQDDSTNHDMLLVFWGSDHRDPAVEVRIPVEHLLGFMRQVANVGGSILSDAISDIAAGECATCRNVGMVNEPRPNGRGPERVHCPDCGPRRPAETILRDAPRVRPSGFRQEQP